MGRVNWPGAPSGEAQHAEGLRGEDPDDRIARAFHEAYERLAPRFGYNTREASAVPWEDVPDANKRLMRATVRDLLDDGVISDRVEDDRFLPEKCVALGLGLGLYYGALLVLAITGQLS